jgi:BirA family biotin operon repressor/biotin-[acetyl-CoA-carboxylase] ligase
MIQGWRRDARASVASTNDDAKAAAAAGDPGRLIITATEQTAGRGRLGRQWLSPPGNLYASLLIRPTVATAVAGQLSLLAGVAAAEAIDTPDIRLKWPNDLMIGDAKCGGILVEAGSLANGMLDWAVIGIGVNLVPVAGAPSAVASTTLDADQLAHRLVEAIDRWIERWLAEGLAPVRAAWLARAWRFGDTLTAGPATGRFVDLADDGALVLETPSGRQRVTAGAVGVAA